MTDDITQVEDELEDSTDDDTQPDDTDDSPSSEPESPADGGDDDDDSEGGDEEYEPFKHSISYKANGEDKNFDFVYTDDGSFTPETEENIRQVLSKTGLERVAQDKDRRAKEAEQKAQQLEAQVKYWKEQAQSAHTQYAEPLQAIKGNPAINQLLQRRGVNLPDPERLKSDMERQEWQAEKQQMEQQKFVQGIASGINNKYPDYNEEQLNAIGSRLSGSPAVRAISSNPNARLTDFTNDVLAAADDVIAGMIHRGELPNPTLEKAKAELENAKKQSEVQKARSKKRLAAVNPIASGKARGGRGRDKGKNLEGMSARDYAAHLKKQP